MRFVASACLILAFVHAWLSCPPCAHTSLLQQHTAAWQPQQQRAGRPAWLAHAPDACTALTAPLPNLMNAQAGQHGHAHAPRHAPSRRRRTRAWHDPRAGRPAAGRRRQPPVRAPVVPPADPALDTTGEPLQALQCRHSLRSNACMKHITRCWPVRFTPVSVQPGAHTWEPSAINSGVVVLGLAWS